jgi:hypothetical protein
MPLLIRFVLMLGLFSLLSGCSATVNEVIYPSLTTSFSPPNGPIDKPANAPGIYVADTGNSRIVHADDITGKNWTSFGTQGEGKGHFGSPGSVFLDEAGHIYIGDNVQSVHGATPRLVRMDDMTGKNWISFDPVGLGKEPFSYISGLFVDKQQHIYVTDMQRGRIIRMDDMTGKNYIAYGKSSLLAQGIGAFTMPNDVAVDSQGHIYVLERSDLVRMDDMSGKGWTRFSAVNPKKLDLPLTTRMCLDKADRIYIASKGADMIIRMDDITGKNLTGFAETSDRKVTLNQPYGVYVDQGGHLYITDGIGLDKRGESLKKVRVVRIEDLTGKNWTVWGAHGNGKNQFAIPYSIFVR